MVRITDTHRRAICPLQIMMPCTNRRKDDQVVTMYLTVQSGNASEGTNHTWTEINQYSVYDYESMGVDRYKVEGTLKVGNESGPVLGEFGYEAATPNVTVSIRGQSSSSNAQKNYKIRIRDGKGSYQNQKIINLNKHMSEATPLS